MARVFSVPIPGARRSFSSHEAYRYTGHPPFWPRKKTSGPGLQVTLHNMLVSPNMPNSTAQGVWDPIPGAEPKLCSLDLQAELAVSAPPPW